MATIIIWEATLTYEEWGEADDEAFDDMRYSLDDAWDKIKADAFSELKDRQNKIQER